MITIRVRSIVTAVILAGITTSLVGCRDNYLNNRDTLALTAGSAMRGNTAVHTIDPWPAVARRTTRTTDAKKVINAIENYREKPRKSTAPAQAPKTTNK